MSRTTSFESEHAGVEDTWPALNDSAALPIPTPHHEYLPHLHGDDAKEIQQEAFRGTAQVTSIVSGIRRAVCVPLSLAAGAVEPYPEAAQLLYMVRQAVKAGNLSTRDAAGQLVALLRDREQEGGRPRSQLGARRTPPGFGDASYSNMSPSPYPHVEPSTGSSASSSPFSQQQQQQGAGAYPMPIPSMAHTGAHQQSYAPAAQQQQQSVWNDATSLPGVSFSMPPASAVPQHVQALWHQPSGQAGQQQPEYSARAPAGNGPFAHEPTSQAATRYAPPGMSAANGRPAYTPLGLANRM